MGRESLLQFPEETERHSASVGENRPAVDPITATPEQMIDMSPTLTNMLGRIPNTCQKTTSKPTNTTALDNVPSPVWKVCTEDPEQDSILTKHSFNYQ